MQFRKHLSDLSRRLCLCAAAAFCLAANAQQEVAEKHTYRSEGNPIFTHKFTADPAPLVVGDTLWLFTGVDGGPNLKRNMMREWAVFSTTDLKTWTEHPTPLRLTDFAWAKGGKAYAAQAVRRNGKYYWYVSTDRCGIGVAVSDRPEGPYKDALGHPLLTNEDCYASDHAWACIDPTVLIDDDGQAWLFWGNGECYCAKLKDNMTEIDGPVKQVKFDGLVFEEAPWIHKHDGKYYLSYSEGFPEKTAYAMADSIGGPYKSMGLLNELAGNCVTNHHGIAEFKGKWYFFYHNGALRGGGNDSRSVCVDRLYNNPDGSLRRVQMTTEGTGCAAGK